MKRSRDLGTFVAVARAARTGTFARRSERDLEISYAEVEVELVDGLAGGGDIHDHRLEESVSAVYSLGRSIRWRGGYTAAAIHRTLRSLLAMGATFPDQDPTNLEGIGSRLFRACVVAVECDTEETHGTAGVHRVFVRQVLSLDGAASRRWTMDDGREGRNA
jgi:hypothetical protein